MTRLLVSVRNASEARAALAGGADIIDVKEPDRGALGAADPETWRDVLKTVGGRVRVSAALGELYDKNRSLAAVQQLAMQTDGLSFAKIGLAGAASDADWRDRFQQLLGHLPRSVTPVAVAYADWQTANSPSPKAVVDAGVQFGCQAVLFDTFSKKNGHLLDHLSLLHLANHCKRARSRHMSIVLAGSLSLSLIPRVLKLHPEILAVRGAACRRGRRGVIDAILVSRWAAALHSHSLAVRGEGAQV